MPGYEDESGRVRWTRVVYVIDLDPVACNDKRASCGGCSNKPVYVGQTALDPEERFQRHKSRIRSSRWVRIYGIRVNAELADGYGEFATVSESQADRAMVDIL